MAYRALLAKGAPLAISTAPQPLRPQIHLNRFGFPKGSLQKSTEDLFKRAGFRLDISERGYIPKVWWPAARV